MSDPIPPPSAPEARRRSGFDPNQLRAILWLRSRISRNQWGKAGRFGRFLSILFTLAGVVVALGGLAFGIFAGSLGLESAADWEILLVWDTIAAVFLFFWVGYLLVDVQRSETIDATKLLHLPVTPGQVFVLNYVASWVSPMLIIAAPGMIGLAVGLAIGRGARYLWLVPLIFGFLGIVTSFTYWLRGWLAGLMVNPRRRRSILVGLGMSVVLLSQLPNLWFNVIRTPARARPPRTITEVTPPAEGTAPANSAESEKESPKDLLLRPVTLLVHRIVPLLWLPGGAFSLVRGSVWPAALGAAGSAAIGAWALRRAHRSALRAYLGADDSGGPAKRAAVAARGAAGTASTATANAAKRKPLIERSLPFVSEQTSAVAVATLRCYLRAPEARMGLTMPFVMLVCFGAMALRPGVVTEPFQPLLPGGMVVAILFGWVQFAVNQFGFDRSGFRALLLSPVPRRHILLAKNLTLLIPSLLVQVMISAVLIALGRHDLELIAAAGAQYLTGFLLLCLLGNWASVAAPYRVSQGTMRRPKLSRKAVITGLMLVVSFPLSMLPAIAPSILGAACRAFDSLPGVPVALLSSLLLLAATALLYALLLGAQGRYLETHEREVLEVVTHEIE